MNIGYIGLGLMGLPCALNLMKHEYSLFIWARRTEVCNELGAKGATVCASPAEVASQVDILFTNLTDSPDVEDVLFSENGIVSSGKKGLIVVDMSTISALKAREFARRLHAAGMEFVDAPVSGGTAGAHEGTLTFMVGSSEATFNRITPVLKAMGKTITRIGDSGAGQVAKSCNQICITASILGLAEATAFAKANDVDFTPIRAALMGGLAASKSLEVHGQRMINDDFSPGFKTVLHLKDMRIVDTIAEEKHLHLPVSHLGVEMLEYTVKKGFGEQDSSAMSKILHDFGEQ